MERIIFHDGNRISWFGDSDKRQGPKTTPGPEVWEAQERIRKAQAENFRRFIENCLSEGASEEPDRGTPQDTPKPPTHGL